jgi:hypothetical protein
MSGMSGGHLQQPDELINGHPRLLDDARQCAPLEVFMVVGNGDAKGRLVRMLEDVMAPRCMMHEKTPSLEGL